MNRDRLSAWTAVVLGVAGALYAGAHTKGALEAREWPRVLGTVEESRPVSGAKGYAYRYSFSVGRTAHQGSHTARLDHRSGGLWGDTISVWYDPERPTASRVKVGAPWPPAAAVAMSLCVLIVGIRRLT